MEAHYINLKVALAKMKKLNKHVVYLSDECYKVGECREVDMTILTYNLTNEINSVVD